MQSITCRLRSPAVKSKLKSPSLSRSPQESHGLDCGTSLGRACSSHFCSVCCNAGQSPQRNYMALERARKALGCSNPEFKSLIHPQNNYTPPHICPNIFWKPEKELSALDTARRRGHALLGSPPICRLIWMIVKVMLLRSHIV